MAMQSLLLWGAAALYLSTSALAQNAPANPQIDYLAFVELTSEVAPYRDVRRIPLEAFLRKAQSSEAIILDTRSAAAFAQGRIEGAVNLPFSDFTDEKLAKVLGNDTSRPILIYCNNNFSDNAAPVVAKRAPLALNIPTFINLYGYGYTNIWELADVVPTSDVAWISSADNQSG